MKGNVAVVVRRASEGDRAAWEMLVTEYSGLLWAVTRRFRLDEAQRADAVQTTWLRLFEHLDDIREPESLPGWLATTVRRVCLESLRGSKREEPIESLHEHAGSVGARNAEPDDTCPVRSALRREHQALVRRVLAELPDKHRRLMNLLLAAPAPSYREVSAQLGMPVGSIGPTRARILARMREMLAASDLNDLALS